MAGFDERNTRKRRGKAPRPNALVVFLRKEIDGANAEQPKAAVSCTPKGVLPVTNNGVQAMSEASDGPRQMLISTGKPESGGVLVAVQDSGPGLATCQDFLATIVASIGNGFEIGDAEDFLRPTSDVGELRSIRAIVRNLMRDDQVMFGIDCDLHIAADHAGAGDEIGTAPTHSMPPFPFGRRTVHGAIFEIVSGLGGEGRMVCELLTGGKGRAKAAYAGSVKCGQLD
jgi:hypothetical protein